MTPNIRELRVVPSAEGHEVRAYFYQQDVAKMPTNPQLKKAIVAVLEAALDDLKNGETERGGFSHGKTPTSMDLLAEKRKEARR